MDQMALLALAEQRLTDAWNETAPPSELVIPASPAERMTGAGFPWWDIFKMLFQLALALLPFCLMFAVKNGKTLPDLASERSFRFVAMAQNRVWWFLLRNVGFGVYRQHGERLTNALLLAAMKSTPEELQGLKALCAEDN